MIEQVPQGIMETISGGSSKLKFSGLVILIATVTVLLTFAIFGDSDGRAVPDLTGSVTGGSPVEEIAREDLIIPVTNAQLSEEGKYKLILNVLKLRKLNKNSSRFQFAEKVSSIADYVKLLNNRRVSHKWDSLINCLESGCGEEYMIFLEMILEEAFVESADSRSFIEKMLGAEPTYPFINELLHSIIKLERAAETGDIVLSSKAMIEANSLIGKIDSTEIIDLWNQLVDCDLQCSELYEQLLVQITQFKINNN